MSKTQLWPAELDALIAAPEHHQLLMENTKVRVLDTKIKPGETTHVHTHQWPSVNYIMSWSDFVRRDGEGIVLVDTRKSSQSPPSVIWMEPLEPHSLENVGENLIHLIGVEVKPSTS